MIYENENGKKVNVFNERVDRRGLLVLLLLPLPLLLTPPCGHGGPTAEDCWCCCCCRCRCF